MRKSLILFISFAFICTLNASEIADLTAKGLPVNVLSSGKSYKVFEQYRGKVILLCFTASPARTAWKNNQLIWRPPDKLTLISGTGH